MQELCYLKNAEDGRYEDITVFLADGLVKGVSSRISATHSASFRIDTRPMVILEEIKRRVIRY